MTLDERIVAERQALLAEKLEAVERLAGHLKFSLGGNPYPLGSLSVLDPVLLESVSALVERFGKLQDLLSGVFRVCNFGDSNSIAHSSTKQANFQAVKIAYRTPLPSDAPGFGGGGELSSPVVG
jgi:hypothetical protein